MKTKSLSIFLVALFVVEMNLGAEEDNNKDKEGENFEYKKMKDNPPKIDFSSNIILIGDSNVGKSALITKICKNEFPDVYSPTVGFDFFYLKFKIVSDEDEPVLKYQIWDCSGGENYRSIFQNFYKSARVCLLAYDVTDEKSFKDIENWVNDVKNNNKSMHFVLIGNKIDLKDKRVVSKETGKNFAEKNGMKFVEVSAKTDAGIKDLENILAKIIYEEFKKENIYEKFKVEYDSESDFMVLEKPTHSSSLCDCCKEICENC